MSESTGRPGTPEEFNAALSRVQVLEGKKSAAALGLALEALAHPDEPCRQWGERQVRVAKGSLGAEEPQASLRLLSDAIFGEDRALAVAAAAQLWPLRVKLKAPEKIKVLEIAMRAWKEAPLDVAVAALLGLSHWKNRFRAKQAPPGFLEAFVALMDRGLDEHGQQAAASALARLKDVQRRGGRILEPVVRQLLSSEHSEVRYAVITGCSWELSSAWSSTLIAAHEQRDMPEAATALIRVLGQMNAQARARVLSYPISDINHYDYCYYLFRLCGAQHTPDDLGMKCAEALLSSKEEVRRSALNACVAFFEPSWNWEPGPFGRLLKATLESVDAASVGGALALAQALGLDGALWRYGVELQQQLKAALADASTEVSAQVSAALNAAAERLQAAGHGEEAARLLEAWRPLVPAALQSAGPRPGLFGALPEAPPTSPLAGLAVMYVLNENSASIHFEAERLRWSVGDERGEARYQARALDAARTLIWVEAQPGFALVLDLKPAAATLMSAGEAGAAWVLEAVPLERVERP